MITVELKDGQKLDSAEVAICFDAEGLEFLIQKLTRLRNKIDHEHLMTPSWAGDGLSEEKQGNGDHQIVNHLRLVKL